MIFINFALILVLILFLVKVKHFLKSTQDWAFNLVFRLALVKRSKFSANLLYSEILNRFWLCFLCLFSKVAEGQITDLPIMFFMICD